MALVNIQVPDIGDFDEVGVIELLVKAGDRVAAEQSLITVESDKASMEIPSSHAGVVKEITVQLGDKVRQGSVIAVLEAAEAAATAAVASEPKTAPAPATPAAAAIETQAPAAAPAASATIEVRVPDIGDFKDVAVIELLVKVGDTIKVEQSLFTVESDKASMEIPSPAAGVLKELKVKIGDTVNIGDLVAVLEGAAGASAPAAAAAAVADIYGVDFVDRGCLVGMKGREIESLDQVGEGNMKITLRKDKNGNLSVYVPKKDLEQDVVFTEKATLWGGQITLGNGWKLQLPEMAVDTPMPITIEAAKLSEE